MKNEAEQLEALQDIRKMMKESSRFLSLSGLSGILAGFYALAGAYIAGQLIEKSRLAYQSPSPVESDSLTANLIVVAILVLVFSLATAFILSGRKAKRAGHSLFDHTSKKLLWSMGLPLAAGGVFCLALIKNGGDNIILICPSMLIFYGLALLAGSRLTLAEVKYMGYLQVLLGLIGCFYEGHPLLFWSLGFGFVHIIYGAIMWYKYERK